MHLLDKLCGLVVFVIEEAFGDRHALVWKGHCK